MRSIALCWQSSCHAIAPVRAHTHTHTRAHTHTHTHTTHIDCRANATCAYESALGAWRFRYLCKKGANMAAHPGPSTRRATGKFPHRQHSHLHSLCTHPRTYTHACSGEDLHCRVCDKPTPEDTMLICDNCERGYHMDTCLNPAMQQVSAHANTAHTHTQHQ
jgi:hypothetical protein